MSFVGVLGSKRLVCDQLVQMMSPEAFGECFIDLFTASGSVFYGKTPPARINVLNDLDPDMVLVHVAIQRDHAAVEAECRMLPNDDETFERALRLRESREWDNVPEARRAALVLYILKQTVNSNQTILSSSSKCNSSFNPNIALSEYAAKLERAQIRHWPYEKCIDVYLYRSPQVEAFVFADPPYVAADTQKHYRFNFHPVEHIRFWHRMTRLSKDNGPNRNVTIMITYDDHPLIRALYRESDGWRITPLAMAYNSAHDQTACRSELVITNYDPPHPVAGTGIHAATDTGLRLTTATGSVWTDVPDLALAASIDGVPFEQLPCCDKERTVMAITGNTRSNCRICQKKLTLKSR